MMRMTKEEIMTIVTFLLKMMLALMIIMIGLKIFFDDIDYDDDAGDDDDDDDEFLDAELQPQGRVELSDAISPTHTRWEEEHSGMVMMRKVRVVTTFGGKLMILSESESRDESYCTGKAFLFF